MQLYVEWQSNNFAHQDISVTQMPSLINSSRLSRRDEFADVHAAAISISGVKFRMNPQLRPVAEYSLESSEFKIKQNQTFDALALLASQWKARILDPLAGQGSRELTKTTDPLFRALLQYGPGGIDLRDLPEDRINGIHLAVVLRATFTKKHQVPGWSRALQLAKKSLESNGANIKSALGGLI